MDKPTLYARLGIREYFLFDYQEASITAYYLPTLSATKYFQIQPQSGRYYSSVFGLSLSVDDGHLRFRAGETKLLDSSENVVVLNAIADKLREKNEREVALREAVEAQRQAAETQRQIAEAQRESEAQARKLAEAEKQAAEERASREAERAAKESERAAKESERASKLEAELAQLRALLEKKS